MDIKETIATSIGALTLNKVRSLLTMLGVVIGVFAVISLVSLVEGVQNYVEDQFEDLGSNLIFVASGNVGYQGGRPGENLSSSNLKEKHLDLIETEARDYIEYVTPTIQTLKTVKYKTNSYYSSVIGVSYNADKIFAIYPKEGRFFNRSEQNTSSKVVIIGNVLYTKLFGNENPVKKNVKIDGHSYEVLGYLEKKNPDYDEALIIPYTTLRDDFEGTTIISIVAKARSGVDIKEAVERVELALYRDLNDDEFTVLTPDDILESIDSILGILTIALAAIAGISLLVGGIGIMNIMLVSVTERTKEIGLRKALGATSRDIKRQFMIEAVLISALGGLIGLLFGWLVTVLIKSFINASVPFWAIPLSLGFSILVGVVFGTYPAAKASEKDPIEALRYE
jgi:putative ABC transport system permease protein